jgi:hypothetical protein
MFSVRRFTGAAVTANRGLVGSTLTPVETDTRGEQVALDPTAFDKQFLHVYEHMNQMQAQAEKLCTTLSPQERHRLLQEHWTSLQDAMSTMQGVWGTCMINGGPMMGWAQAQGDYSSLTIEQLRQRQYMMDQYLSMQQRMMNQMMCHQQWMHPQPAPVGAVKAIT